MWIGHRKQIRKLKFRVLGLRRSESQNCSLGMLRYWSVWKRCSLLETRKNIYFALIIPHFNYCSETWHFCSKSASAKLEKVNERARRFVFNKKQTQYQELLNKIGLRSLTNQRLPKIVCMVYKAIHYDHAPKSIKSYQILETLDTIWGEPIF